MPDATAKGPVVPDEGEDALSDPETGRTYRLFIKGDTRKPIGWMNYEKDVSKGMDPWKSYGPNYSGKEVIWAVCVTLDGKSVGWSYMVPDTNLHPNLREI